MILCIIKKTWNLGGKSLEKIDIFLNMDIDTIILSPKNGGRKTVVYLLFSIRAAGGGGMIHIPHYQQKKSEHYTQNSMIYYVY